MGEREHCHKEFKLLGNQRDGGKYFSFPFVENCMNCCFACVAGVACGCLRGLCDSATLMCILSASVEYIC